MHSAIIIDMADAVITKTNQGMIIRSCRWHNIRLIEGMRLLLGHIPKELEEYRKYGGVRYVLLRAHNKIIRALVVDELRSIRKLNNDYLTAYRQYVYQCCDVDYVGIDVDPNIEIVYWNPITRTVRQ